MPYPIFRIMVSSTFLDLAPERAAVVKALRDLNLPLCSLGIALTPIDLQEGASTQPPLDVCLAEARQADLVITILGLRNGWVTPNNRSITECEFDEARAASRDVLAYFKRPESVTLPEHTEKDPGGQKSLAAFKKKIDSQLKRDVFSDSSELRGHVIRDILSWALFRPEILSKFCRDPNAPSFTKIKEYLEVINSTNIEATVNTVCSRKFTLDMHRFGVEELHRATLTDLLELSSFNLPKRVTDPVQRARLLFELLQHFPQSVASSAALEEARNLESRINDPNYSRHLRQFEAKAFIGSQRYDLAFASLKRLAKLVKTSAEPHDRVEAWIDVGTYYQSRGDRQRALRWFWRSIKANCRMLEMCPYCLSKAFLESGKQLIAVGQCDVANNRLAKSLAVARVIPDRMRQAAALEALAQHWVHHGELHLGIAAYVWEARLLAEAAPNQEAADIGTLLGDVIAKHGRDTVRIMVEEVGLDSEQIVLKALKPHELDTFVKKLAISPSKFGDHW